MLVVPNALELSLLCCFFFLMLDLHHVVFKHLHLLCNDCVMMLKVCVFSLRLASFMRSPMFRIFFLVYCILLHAWVFFVLFTYTPEIHPL